MTSSVRCGDRSLAIVSAGRKSATVASKPPLCEHELVDGKRFVILLLGSCAALVVGAQLLNQFLL